MKFCPFLKTVSNSTGGEQTENPRECLGEKCALWTNYDNKNWNTCSFADIAFWLKEIDEKE